MVNFLYLFGVFIVYSILGYICEVLFCSFLVKKWVNRGFFFGPWCPIYGFGALIFIICLNEYQNDIKALFFLGALGASILEYVTSYFMEKIFKNRWWDYSDHKFHLNGRVCLSNTIYFGLFAILVVRYFNPFLVNLFLSIPIPIYMAIANIILVLFIIDVVCSIGSAYSISAALEKIHVEFPKISKEDIVDIPKNISLKTKGIIDSGLFQIKRLLAAFPNIKSSKYPSTYYELLKKVSFNDKKTTKKVDK